MTQVKKRSGELEVFDRKKLFESMRKAGANEQVAKLIAEKLEVADGTPTMDIRNLVATELHAVNTPVGEAYATTLRLKAKGHDDVPKGTARIPKRIERIPDVKAGQPARVKHREVRTEVRIEPVLEAREVWLNRNDFAILGAPEGTRIAVRFLREDTGVPLAPAMAAQPAQPVPSMTPKAA